MEEGHDLLPAGMKQKRRVCMRRCYRGAALALGGILMTGLTSQDSCSFGTITVYAAEDTLTEELETAFQEEVRTGEGNVETDIPSGEKTEEPETEAAAEEPEEESTKESGCQEAAAELPEAESDVKSGCQEAAAETTDAEPDMDDISAESIGEETESKADGELPVEEAVQSETAAEEPAQEETAAEEPVQEAEGGFHLEEREYQVLLKIVEAEAGGEDSTGRMLVANVIMNRVRSTRFPNSITDVVYQRCGGKAQFSPVTDGRIDSVRVSPETVEAVARAVNGEDASGGALYFRSVYSSSAWFDQSLHRVVEHGNHIFYTM